MPRQYRKKKKYGRKKRSPYGGYLNTASKALSVAYAVKRLVNVEFKHHNVVQQAQAVTDAGLITNLSLLSQGDSSTTRDGGSVKFTSLRLSYMIGIHASATLSVVRVMIVHDKQTNQAQFTLADLLFDATIVDNILSPYNINNASRFNVLYDKVHTLNIAGSSGMLQRTIHRKLNMKTRYDANVGDVTDLTQDSLSMIFISDQPTNDPNLSLNYRSRFIDN